jgi:hypothetical protein
VLQIGWSAGLVMQIQVYINNKISSFSFAFGHLVVSLLSVLFEMVTQLTNFRI